MSDHPWREALCRRLTALDIPWQRDVPLAPLTTFRIGGPGALLCRPQNAAQAAALWRLLCAEHLRSYCLGRGSNTLFADEGFDGVVIVMEALSAIEPRQDTLYAAAGAPLAAVCKAAQAAGLAGLEFAYGIPGAVGGALYMNAGAYGGEMRDVVQSVEALDAQGAPCTLQNADCRFGYRHSVFEEAGGMILAARFALRRDDPAAIAARMEEYAARRKEKQPLEWPSAGSTFKRPQGAFAAALIDSCGLKGLRVGGACVSEKHAGFVVNTGGASCADVLALTEQVAAIVKEKTGHTLEREIRVVR